MGRPITKTKKISVVDLNTDKETFYTTQIQVANTLKASQASVSYAIIKKIALFGRYIITKI